MKKIFLSLAAIALVAVSTVSCGKDDSKDGGGTDPVKPVDPVVQADNTVRFDEKDSPLDFSYYELITKNYAAAGAAPAVQVNVYQYPDGGYANGYYVNVGYNMTQEGADTYHYAMILVPNPTIKVEGGSITNFGTPVLPHQAEKITWLQAAVSIGGKNYESTQNNIGSGSVKVNTLVLQPNADEDMVGTSNFVSQFTLGANSFNFKFNGDTFLDYYLSNPPAAARKALSNSDVIKADMAKTIKSLEVSNVLVK